MIRAECVTRMNHPPVLLTIPPKPICHGKNPKKESILFNGIEPDTIDIRMTKRVLSIHQPSIQSSTNYYELCADSVDDKMAQWMSITETESKIEKKPNRGIYSVRNEKCRCEWQSVRRAQICLLFFYLFFSFRCKWNVRRLKRKRPPVHHDSDCNIRMDSKSVLNCCLNWIK